MKTTLLKKIIKSISICAITIGLILCINVKQSYANDANNTQENYILTMSDDDKTSEEEYHKSLINQKCQEVPIWGDHVWYTKEYNTVSKKMPDGQYFRFNFNMRGWFGNNSSDLARHAHVQFFFNTSTKELALLTFGPAQSSNPVKAYKTFGFSPLAQGWSVYTVLEDSRSFDDKVNYRISEKCRKMYVDPNITAFGRISQQCLHSLEEIDTCCQEYDHCAYYKSNLDEDNFDDIFATQSFRHIGEDTQNGTNMKFLKCFSEKQCRILAENMGDWAPGSKVKINDKKYEN
ncbi:MAG: hypothetical protein Q4E88_06880 [Coriobacteriia bacterium]|nr:hypothetical protein [Coriobacteriia bacterium]